MNTSSKVVLALVFALALIIPTKKAFCYYDFYSSGGDARELVRIDDPTDSQIPNKGVYGYFDKDAQKWITVLDFNVSDQPLISGCKVVWVDPAQGQDY